ncbi:hypothetical protein BBJ28_00020351 [Nothophytophthora sp. Chile5]|nr:hypothetical protein BBJ28_00020351 [Nothophytophthora sp. Chile5]
MVKGKRQRLHEDGGRRPKQYKRDVPTYEFRLAVVTFFKATSIAKALERFYHGLEGTPRETARKNIYYWAKNISKIQVAGSSNSIKSKKKLRAAGTATVLSPATDLQLVRWINAYRDDGAPISSMMLRLKALEFAEATGVRSDLFTATRSWRIGFLRRHSLRFRARIRQGQIPPADSAKAVMDLNAKLRSAMDSLGVDVAYTADQTPIFFEYVPKTTIAKKGVKTVWVRTNGKDTECMVCMLLSSSFGEKRTPFLVLKSTQSKIPETRAENNRVRHGFGKVLWKEVERLQSEYEVQIYGNRCGWWDSRLSVIWLDYHFKGRQHPERPVVLLWDLFSGHWSLEVVNHAKSINVHLVEVPGGHTSVCQPADCAWNRPLKQRMRRHWVQRLAEQLADGSDERPAAIKSPSREEVVRWTTASSRDLATSTISNGFLAFFASHQMNRMLRLLLTRLQIN